MKLKLIGMGWVGIGLALTVWAVFDFLTGRAALAEFRYRTTYTTLVFIAPGWGLLAVREIAAGLTGGKGGLTPAILFLSLADSILTVLGIMIVTQ